MRIFRLGCVAGALLLASPPALAAEETWRAVPLPFLWRDSGLRAVAATGPGDVWVAGYQGYKVLPHPVNVVSHGSPVVRRWDGAAWREYPLNGWGGPGWAPRLAAGPSGVWLSTGWWDGQRDYLARFDGTAFRPVAPPPGREPEVLDAGPAGVWLKNGRPGAVHGEWALYRRAGDAWAEVPVPGQVESIAEIRARTATEVWAVGRRRGGWTDNYAVLRWDGSSWHEVPVPDAPGRPPGWGLEHVAPVSAGEVWVSGNGEIGHWRDGAWTFSAPPMPQPDVGDVAVDAAGTPWVVALAPDGARRALYRRAGDAWREAPLPPGTSPDAVTAVPGSAAMWAVGARPDPAGHGRPNSATAVTTD
ncbi:hypothetical protein ACSNOI_35040 [Actinomadura kijaniata]|uniref:hypothetical protein n=1 Tax=Actinomadura kijaniata TaxID=46161 RepID=UPI003F1C3777